MTSNEQYPGSDQPLEPTTDIPLATPTNEPAASDLQPTAPIPQVTAEPTVVMPPVTAEPTVVMPSVTAEPTVVMPSVTAEPTVSMARSVGQASPSGPPPGYPAPGAGMAGFPPPGQPGAFPAPRAPSAAASQGYPPPGQTFPGPGQSFPAPGQPYPPPPMGGPTPYAAPGQPYAGQPPAAAAYPFPPGGQPAAPPKKGSKVPLFIGGGVLILIIAVILGSFMLPGGGGFAAPNRAGSAKAAVEGYLKAIAAGDASAALDFGTAAPTETSLLTDEVLQASILRAPITNIIVADATGSESASVNASYQVGAKSVSASYLAEKVGTEWRLADTTHELQLFSMDGVALTVNGIAVAADTSSLTLFPGSYALASANDRLQIEGGEFVVESPTDYNSPSFSVDLSDKGITDARTAAQSLLNSCVKQKKLAPTGCGFFLRLDGKAKTVKWRIRSGSDAIKKATFTQDSTEPYVAKAYVYISLEASGTTTAGRRFYTTRPAYISSIQADVSGPTVAVKFNS